MTFNYKTPDGKEWWLHMREGRGGAKLFFFSKSPEEGADLPSGYEVFISPRTKIPMLRKSFKAPKEETK
jgi:hypothetical protein